MRSRFLEASRTIPTSKKRMAAAKTKVFLDGCLRFYVDGPCWALARKADVSFVGFQEAAAKPNLGRRPFRPNLEAAMQNLTLSLFWILTATPLRATSARYCQKYSRWGAARQCRCFAKVTWANFGHVSSQRQQSPIYSFSPDLSADGLNQHLEPQSGRLVCCLLSGELWTAPLACRYFPLVVTALPEGPSIDLREPVCTRRDGSSPVPGDNVVQRLSRVRAYDLPGVRYERC
jgi:hypothetical protein